MWKTELNWVSAALRNMTPVQRKLVAAELASFDRQPAATVVVEGRFALAGAARQLGVEHHAINLSAGIRVDGAWHVQNVKAYHSRLKGRVHRFRALDREHGNSPKPAQWLAMALGEAA